MKWVSERLHIWICFFISRDTVSATMYANTYEKERKYY